MSKRQTVGESDVAVHIRYAEKQIIDLIGAILSDKEQRDHAKKAASYIFTETLRTYKGIDKK